MKTRINLCSKYLAMLLGSAISAGVAHGGGPLENAYKHANLALISFSERIEHCADLRTPIPSRVFQDINATKDQLRLILSYHSALASFECSRKEATTFLIYSSIIQSLDTETSSHLAEGNYAVVHDMVTVLQRETEYRELPERMLVQLEAIEDLKLPFDLAGTAKALGLE